MRHSPICASAISRCLALAVFLAVVAIGCHPGKPDRIRIVVFTLDTLRLDAVFPSQEDQTSSMPRLAMWAEYATIFDNFYSSTSTTQPTHASMFTGLHPWQHGVTRNGLRLSGSFGTISEELQEMGYSTAAVVASFPVSRSFGFNQGFDIFQDDFHFGKVNSEWRDYAGREEEGLQESFYSIANQVADEAIQLLESTQGDLQFFWFHFFDPHDPYGDTTTEHVIGPMNLLQMAEKGEDTALALQEARRLYSRDVQFLDEHLYRVLAAIDEASEEFETHIILVSDHGESLGEFGSMGHGSRLTPPEIHVPCVVRSPLLAPGRRNDTAGSIDIAATVLAFARVDQWLGGGRDLAFGKVDSVVYGMLRTYDEWQTRARLDGKKYSVGQLLFYAVRDDHRIVKGNSRDVWSEHGVDRATSDRLRTVFLGFERELRENSFNDDLEAKELEALRALGYVE